MRKFVSIVTALTLAGSLITGNASQLLDQTIAVVEQDIILESELARNMKAVARQIRERNQQVPPNDVLQQQVLERIIVSSLQLQIAKRAGVRVSEQELNSAIADVAKNSEKTIAQLRLQMEEDNINWELFREDIREEMMIARIRNGQVMRRVSVSEREIENLVKLIDSQGEQNIQYHLGHILIRITDSSDQQAIQVAREKATDLVKQLRDGANFQNLAIQHSAGQEALQGGDFGWRPANQLPTLFAGPAKSLATGGISEPLRSGSGFHILKLLEKKGDLKHVVQQIDVRHILISPNTILSEEDALAKVQSIRKRVLEGEAFDDLAKQFSEDKGSALQGGELGWGTSDKFVGPFKDAVDTLPLNELSQPVKTQFGWHIIEVRGRRDADQTTEFKREQAARMLQRRKFDEELESWIRELRDTSYVEMLVDTK